MLFTPEKYQIEDIKNEPFISVSEIETILTQHRNPSIEQVREVITLSMNRKRLSLSEVAILLNATGEEAQRLILEGANRLKKEIYGERIVIFAPLYIGNHCVNNCRYCGFRAANREAVRRTLSDQEIVNEVKALEREGQKRLILVYGEHPMYDPQFIAHSVNAVYSTSENADRINRVNINAAPLDVEGFRTVKEAGIGTYQVFQETYNPEIYHQVHPSGPKHDYNFRLTSMDRALEAGIDDVGLGVLLGLGDWRFEIMALVRHTNHLEACYNIGPHTISFPRIQRASNIDEQILQPVSDSDFIKLVAILRLAVPYTGLILTAREPETLRNKLIEYGVSQIDAGTRLEIGGYSELRQEQEIEREQFALSDTRSLAQTIDELVERGHIPSFCTACYRMGRTGEHFMEFSTKGFIKRFCGPNALLTFAEYLEEYASAESKIKGWALITEKSAAIEDERLRERVFQMLERVKSGERDIFI